MKQILQSLKNGTTALMDVPAPQLKSGHVLVRSHFSLISKGTEKMLLDFGKASLLEKARQQPEKVRMVFDKIKTDGFLPTLAAVQAKLDQSLPMGYCNVGTICAVGDGINEFSIGDRVVSNGPHAELICVPKHLCCKVPEAVTDEAAAFTVLGAIGLQGLRLAQPTLGEHFVVIGLGLIGLLTAQLLKCHGCQVLGVDVDSEKVALAARLGIVSQTLSSAAIVKQIADQFSNGKGVDGVIITANTKSSEPIYLAADISRKRGRIILVGVTGLNLARQDFYSKELTFQVSCSYGPGRYDPEYEIAGHDYPIGYVRWTEQRNFAAFLDQLAEDALDVTSLISHRFGIDEAEKAYAVLAEDTKSLGILLSYAREANDVMHQNIIHLAPRPMQFATTAVVGVIGAGNYASRVLIPALKKQPVLLHTVACSGGVSGAQIAKKFGFYTVTTEVERIFAETDINTVVIASRHDSHAAFVLQALAASQHIFVEKPLCITRAELTAITTQLAQYNKIFMVGFNRRFAPHTLKIKELLSHVAAPKTFIMTVNAGAVPAHHWTQDKCLGGGRIIGEACHFIDLLRHLAEAPIIQSHAQVLKDSQQLHDTVTITLAFADGSQGTIHYFANGHRAFPKERLEIFVGGKILQCNNFRSLIGYGFKHFHKMNLWRQDKGQLACMRQFIAAVQGNAPQPISTIEIVDVMRATLEIAESL